MEDGQLDSYARRLLILALAIAIQVVDFWLLDLASYLRDWAELPLVGEWNWFGKLTSIGFSCAILASSPWLRQNVGLRWRQAPGSKKLSVSCFAVYFACAVAIGFLMTPTAFSAETLLFQFFMPGIDEELLERGITLALLERAFGQSPMSCRLRFGYAALITSLIFGLFHAVSVVDGQYQISLVQFSVTALWAAMAALVRTRSGSLLWPIIYHGTWDGTIFLVAMLR